MLVKYVSPWGFPGSAGSGGGKRRCSGSGRRAQRTAVCPAARHKAARGATHRGCWPARRSSGGCRTPAGWPPRWRLRLLLLQALLDLGHQLAGGGAHAKPAGARECGTWGQQQVSRGGAWEPWLVRAAAQHHPVARPEACRQTPTEGAAEQAKHTNSVLACQAQCRPSGPGTWQSSSQ